MSLKPIVQEKLPETYHITVVKDLDRKTPWFQIVLTKMQGEKVLGRRVVEPAEPNMDRALDALNHLATRVFYFEEGEQYL